MEKLFWFLFVGFLILLLANIIFGFGMDSDGTIQTSVALIAIGLSISATIAGLLSECQAKKRSERS